MLKLPSRKRIRTEGAAGHDAVVELPFEKSDGLWHRDGSVILVAPKRGADRNSPKRLGFLVHQTVLETRSPVLARIFASPQPSEWEEYEGHLTIHLSDSAEDLVHFLTSLYNPEFFDSVSEESSGDKECSESHLDIVLGVLLLSSKYDVKGLCLKAAASLECWYPAELSKYMKTTLTRLGRVEVAVRAAKVAREVGLLHVLPRIFYTLAGMKTEALLEQIKRDQLNSDDTARCLAGRARLLDVSRNAIYHPLLCSVGRRSWNMDQCTAEPAGKCAADLSSRLEERMIKEFLERTEGFYRYLDWKRTVRDCKAKCCAECLQSFETIEKEEKRKLWDRLPEIFDVGRSDSISVRVGRRKCKGP